MPYHPDIHGIWCTYCGRGLHLGNATLDHVIPRAANGSNKAVNLVACCKLCNSNKGCLSVKEFRRKFFKGEKFRFEERIDAALGIEQEHPIIKNRLDWIY